jgi:hypothetical protein
MKVFFTSAYPFDGKKNYTPSYLKESYLADPFKVHQLAETAEEADMIIFAENHPPRDPYFFGILKNEIYKKYRHKCYVYHVNYLSVNVVPTISPTISLENYNPVFHQPYSYLVHLTPNEYITKPNPVYPKKYLFSFLGALCADPARAKLFDIKHDRYYVKDTSDKYAWELSDSDRKEYAKTYAAICFQSKFILCPRGNSPNSYRLYESLKIGIVPVIISDDWVPSIGPRWEEFSIRVPEKDIANIPALLEKMEPESSKMGELARQAYVDWFAKDKQFHYLTESCLKLHKSRNKITFYSKLRQWIKFMKPQNAWGPLRFFKNSTAVRLSGALKGMQ